MNLSPVYATLQISLVTGQEDCIMKYAGIGSRQTPQIVLGWMTDIALQMAEAGHTLRTGGAPGADQAFMLGCTKAQGPMEIFLPWTSFEIDSRRAIGHNPKAILYCTVPNWAKMHWQKFHPAPQRCSSGAQALMARNSCQVLGINGDEPSGVIICWTSDGKASGGTGQAIRIAEANGITVVNLNVSGWERRLVDAVPDANLAL